MEELVAQSGKLRLWRRSAERWEIYRITGETTPDNRDLLTMAEALTRSAGGSTRPVCIELGRLRQPSSRLLAALVGLLGAEESGPERVALAGLSEGWLDMLDILGVRSSFILVKTAEELTHKG